MFPRGLQGYGHLPAAVIIQGVGLGAVAIPLLNVTGGSHELGGPWSTLDRIPPSQGLLVQAW